VRREKEKGQEREGRNNYQDSGYSQEKTEYIVRTAWVQRCKTFQATPRDDTVNNLRTSLPEFDLVGIHNEGGSSLGIVIARGDTGGVVSGSRHAMKYLRVTW
jgi:hypothetical protein